MIRINLCLLLVLLQYARSHASDVEARIIPLVQRFAPSLVPALQAVNISAVLSDRNIPQIRLLVLKLAAQAQVSHGVFLLVELLLPTRNFIQLYLWWQFLKMQYMQEQAQPSNAQRPRLIQAAFKDLDQQLTGLLAYRMVPQIVRTGYAQAKTFLAKQVELPTATNDTAGASRSATGGGISGLLSRCQIM